MSYDRSIQQLFRLAKNGDGEARNQLFLLLRVRISTLAKYKIAESEVEDLVQDALVTFFEKFEKIESEEKILPFLFSIVSHKIGNRYQKSQTLRESVSIESMAGKHMRFVTTGGPEEKFGAQEFDNLLARALVRMQQRSPAGAKVISCLLKGYSIEQMKKELRITRVSNVYVKINRARKLIREILKNEFKLDL